MTVIKSFKDADDNNHNEKCLWEQKNLNNEAPELSFSFSQQ